MDSLKEYDVVTVNQLLSSSRHIDGTPGVMRQPQIGDSGTVVFSAENGGNQAMYIVECVDPAGLTLWLADFAREELTLVYVD